MITLFDLPLPSEINKDTFNPKNTVIMQSGRSKSYPVVPSILYQGSIKWVLSPEESEGFLEWWEDYLMNNGSWIELTGDLKSVLLLDRILFKVNSLTIPLQVESYKEFSLDFIGVDSELRRISE